MFIVYYGIIGILSTWRLRLLGVRANLLVEWGHKLSRNITLHLGSHITRNNFTDIILSVVVIICDVNILLYFAAMINQLSMMNKTIGTKELSTTLLSFLLLVNNSIYFGFQNIY